MVVAKCSFPDWLDDSNISFLWQEGGMAETRIMRCLRRRIQLSAKILSDRPETATSVRHLQVSMTIAPPAD